MRWQKQDEEYLKDRIDRLQARLSKICADKGHDIEESATTKRELVGHHQETYRTTGPDCEHTHRCHCPVIEKTRSVGDYEEVITTTKRCKRCGIETTEKKRRRP